MNYRVMQREGFDSWIIQRKKVVNELTSYSTIKERTFWEQVSLTIVPKSLAEAIDVVKHFEARDKEQAAPFIQVYPEVVKNENT